MGVVSLNLLSRIQKGIVEVLFPVFCVSCGAEGEWCCRQCQEMLFRQAILACPVCAKNTIAGGTCPACGKQSPLKGLIAASSYADPVSRKLIKALKFDAAMEAAIFLKRMSTHAIGVAAAVANEAIVVPMPLHKKRERFRGYNQAEIIVDAFFPGAKANVLERIGYRKPQTELDEEERRINPQGVFRAKIKLNGETIILVDDVYTTGATMNEAARILKEAGAGEVWGFVVARG